MSGRATSNIRTEDYSQSFDSRPDEAGEPGYADGRLFDRRSPEPELGSADYNEMPYRVAQQIIEVGNIMRRP